VRSAYDGRITFRDMSAEDLPLLAVWLRVPEVARWFEDASYIETLEGHLADGRIQQTIVGLDGRPIAFLQDYDIHAFEKHPLAYLPQRSRGLDTFIGVREALRQGLGPAYLSKHTDHLFASGAPALGIDPHPDNTAAIRAYEKVGFTADKHAETEWGPVVAMSLFPAP